MKQIGRWILALAILVLASNLLAQTDALSTSTRKLALTFDDAPAANTGVTLSSEEVKAINLNLLAALKKHRAKATAFVNEDKVHAAGNDQVKIRTQVLERWIAEGHTLGNHTYSHPDLNNISAREFEQNIVDGETTSARLLKARGEHLRFFRYPFNHTGATRETRDEVQRFLAGRGYQVATCTVENADYMFNRLYTDALRRNDSELAARIRTAYLDFTDEMFTYFEKRSQQVMGREFPQVFLAHVNRLNADTLDTLLTRMEQRGYSLVTLETAQSDAVYATADNYVGSAGPMWIHRWALAKGMDSDMRNEPDPPTWVLKMYKDLEQK